MNGDKTMTMICLSTQTRFFLLVPCLALFAACSSDRDGGSSSQAAGAAPDPFIGEYTHPAVEMPLLRVTREGGGYFVSILDPRDMSYLPAAAAIECPESYAWGFEDLNHVDPIYICFPSPDDEFPEPFLLLHSRATPVVPELQTTTGYFYALIEEGVERTGPEAQAYASYLAATRAAASPSVATNIDVVTGIFGGPDCFWERMELGDDEFGQATHRQFGSDSVYHFMYEGELIIRWGGQEYAMVPRADGTLDGTRYDAGICVPVR
jgi:hypothetical protein